MVRTDAETSNKSRVGWLDPLAARLGCIWGRSICGVESVGRRWGDERALFDDDQARRRLLEAASRCIARHGDTQVRMAEVADEAGVVRSTVYRYFATRDELLLGLLLSRTDAAMDTVVRSLEHPWDAKLSIPDLILKPISLVGGNALNEALFASESTALASALQSGSEAVIDVLLSHFGPLLERWQTDGQLHSDLDLRETVRWMQSAWLFLLSPAWRLRSAADKQRFAEHYLVRALVVTQDRT
ncbi:MAG: TetR/AcrR family transcriptional regulator [Mycolicibacterium sp.]|nr:TetR/AcrR family transcriptional regulator [Mycolicibacterium sp.]